MTTCNCSGEFQMQISMEKVQERWWEALLEGEPKISTRKIDPSRPITDLGDEEQAKIAEMMYNERQKRLGLPQSHEMVGSLLRVVVILDEIVG